ncbi:hypothetical protein [Paracidovorax valerianellae]|uniref:Uncharacterized protein n=1 Tax=Paracidovorax valerianellae TaxID=187868 RepID=A0A1G7EKZ1_9BURK|nr:hypothetical protein [Paracidovorax valerianellae]MDA8446387.1 hypothetical protein [Paracidovorax valerianellae]SDE64085.1 hypothetical protein SAMN05192589_12354 [Paracidovorax valerianellae]
MSTSIKVFESSQAGAPVLSGTAGALRAVLKACLVDGFGAGAVASLTVTAGVATAVYASGHPYRVGSVALFAGATGDGLNGERRILTVAADRVTFAAPDAAAGAAAGSITSRMAPAGWQELYAGQADNVIALKPAAVEATGCVLRVDDTGTTNARVRGYESMSDIGTGLGAIPLDAQVAEGLYWPKSGAASTAARPWIVVADERGLYLAVSPQGIDRYTLLYAGDIASVKSGDAYGWLVSGNQSDQVAQTTTPDGCCGYSHRSARGGVYLARAHTGVGQAIAAQRIGAHHTGTVADVYAGVAGYAWGAYPNSPNNGLLTGLVEVVGQGVRGTLPGLLHPIQDMGGAFATRGTVVGTQDYAGRTLMAVRVGSPVAGAEASGTVFLDLSGPWSR